MPDQGGDDDSTASKGDSSEGEEGSSSQELFDRAAEIGFSKEEVESWGENAEAIVNRVSTAHASKIAELGKAIIEQQAKAAQQGGEEGATAEQSTVQMQADEDVKKALEDAGFDESDPLYKIMLQQQTMLKQQQDFIDQQKQATQPDAQAAQAKVFEEVEEVFSGMPEDVKALWGGGKIYETKSGTEQGDFVDRMLNTMDALRAGYEHTGKEVKLKDLANQAMSIHAADALKVAHEKEIAGRVKKRKAGSTTPPSQRENTATKPNTEESAKAELREVMEEFGMGGN